MTILYLVTVFPLSSNCFHIYSFNNLVVKSLNETQFDYSEYKPKQIEEGCIEYIDSEESHYKAIVEWASKFSSIQGGHAIPKILQDHVFDPDEDY